MLSAAGGAHDGMKTTSRLYCSNEQIAFDVMTEFLRITLKIIGYKSF
jgi:hypothetical protein